VFLSNQRDIGEQEEVEDVEEVEEVDVITSELNGSLYLLMWSRATMVCLLLFASHYSSQQI
jgi:hypothetical protein